MPSPLLPPADAYLARIQRFTTPPGCTADSISIATAYIAERPQPFDAYHQPLLPHEKTLAYGVRQESDGAVSICWLQRGRWGRWNTQQVITQFRGPHALRRAHASLETMTGCICELDRTENAQPHWLVSPRANPYY